MNERKGEGVHACEETRERKTKDTRETGVRDGGSPQARPRKAGLLGCYSRMYLCGSMAVPLTLIM